MHDLSAELHALPSDAMTEPARGQALRLEQRQVLSVRPELLVMMYVGVATLVAGTGLLIKANLDRIGPMTLLSGIFAASALCYAIGLRARQARRVRSLGEDYILLLGALLFSTAVGYAEVKFRLFGAGWSRQLLLLAAWHLASAYVFRSRLVLSVGLTAFAGWLGVESRLGNLLDPGFQLRGLGPRMLLCAVLFCIGSEVHRRQRDGGGAGFRDVYLHFAVNFAFWGAIALGTRSATRLMGAVLVLVLAGLIATLALHERRQSFLIYAVGYGTIGMILFEVWLLRDALVVSWTGLLTVIGAVLLLFRLRTRLRESAE
jgi:hypothetical protein